MSTLSLKSLAGGELAPVLHARCDTAKYQSGLRTMRNWYTMRESGARNRNGSTYCREVKDSSKTVRLIPFIFSNDQTYICEFGDEYVRFMQNGEYLNYNVATISAITQATEGVVTTGVHGLVDNDRIIITGIVGMTDLNNREFIVDQQSTTTFKLKYLDGTYVNTSAMAAYVSGGAVGYIFQATTVWDYTDLMELTFSQSADTMIICHPDYEPYKMVRGLNIYSQVIFTLTSIASPTPRISAPSFATVGGTVNTPADASNAVFYKVTIVQKGTLEESLPSAAVSSASDGTSGTPNVILTCSPSLSTGNGQFFRFYKSYALEGAYGLVQQNTSNAGAYSDFGDDPDFTRQPPILVTRFGAAGDYPAAVTFAQQRLLLGGSTNAPERIDGSGIGHYFNFTIREPMQDDDAIAWQNSSRKMNRVRHMLELSRLVVFTEAGEWVIEGGGSGELTPTTINPKQHTYNGSGIVPPLAIDDNALYVQAQGNIIRDLSFDYQVDGYRGNDITTFATHLFRGKQIVDWDYQKVPDSIIWAVMDDGTISACTYVREQQIIAWHRHDFSDGFVERVCCIPEGDSTAVYFVVKRTIDGRTVRYIERMVSEFVDDVRDVVYMDSALTYDGRNTSVKTMTMSAPTGWTHTDTITCTASASTFASSNVGDQLFFYDTDETEYRFDIVAYSSATVVTVRPVATIPTALRTVLLAGTATWSLAVDTVSGLWHLEGKQVSVLGDGFVVANPNNSSYTALTVTDAAVTLDRPHAVVTVGLPITADMETLSVDTASAETLVGKKMIVGKVHVKLEKTRGLFVGSEPPPDEDTDFLGGLVELKVRQYENYSSPIDLKTGDAEVVINGQWNDNGRVFIRQTDPLPATVLAIYPDGNFPIRQG